MDNDRKSEKIVDWGFLQKDEDFFERLAHAPMEEVKELVNSLPLGDEYKEELLNFIASERAQMENQETTSNLTDGPIVEDK